MVVRTNTAGGIETTSYDKHRILSTLIRKYGDVFGKMDFKNFLEEIPLTPFNKGGNYSPPHSASSCRVAFIKGGWEGF